jgi:isopentenyl diphosphate isomerase/L-lactate dehydrogenase-like FMN-dependent dehydrogenase
MKSCHNVEDMRLLAKQRLPGPIFHYIDGAADDEVTYRRNTQAFEECDLVPNVLAGVENVDMSVTVMGVKLDMPIFCSPTALQRLFHHDGERAVARAADKFGTMFGVSSLGTVSVEEIGRTSKAPKMFQFYFHEDRERRIGDAARRQHCANPHLFLISMRWRALLDDVLPEPWPVLVGKDRQQSRAAPSTTSPRCA